MNKFGRFALFTLILVVVATACKFFFGPNLDWSGFSPVFAIALVAGFISRDKSASFLLPLVALLLSDVLIEVFYRQGVFPYGGFYDGQWKNYLIVLSCTFVGWALKGRNFTAVLAGGLLAPTLFFFLSNLNVWISNEVVYSRDANGLLDCFIAGLPFYKNALLSTIVFLPVVLWSYNLVMRKRSELVIA